MLDTNFWKKYFRVYDVLNSLIPYQEVLAEIYSGMNASSGMKVLDAGSGTGNLSVFLEAKGLNVTGIDYSEEGVKIHRAKSPVSEVLVGDLTRPLPFPDRSFDCVVSNNTIYTIPENFRPAIVREFWRVLKPGGRVVLSNLSVDFKPIRIYVDHISKEIKTRGFLPTVYRVFSLIVPTILIFYYNYLIRKAHGGGSYKFFEHEEQFNLLQSAGFVNLSETKRVYSGQAVLDVAVKPLN